MTIEQRLSNIEEVLKEALEYLWYAGAKNPDWKLSVERKQVLCAKLDTKEERSVERRCKTCRTFNICFSKNAKCGAGYPLWQPIEQTDKQEVKQKIYSGQASSGTPIIPIIPIEPDKKPEPLSVDNLVNHARAVVDDYNSENPTVDVNEIIGAYEQAISELEARIKELEGQEEINKVQVESIIIDQDNANDRLLAELTHYKQMWDKLKKEVSTWEEVIGSFVRKVIADLESERKEK
jgi:hypothetical protein